MPRQACLDLRVTGSGRCGDTGPPLARLTVAAATRRVAAEGGLSG